MARSGHLRIIAGRWRGRRLDVPDSDGLRPTGDRVRETLFNWLAPIIDGAHVLDLFAGTGALGLEALSRGAAQAIFVERERAVAASLQANLERLGAQATAQVRCLDAMRYLRGRASAQNIVFLDPPFNSAIIDPACVELARHGWLAKSASVYAEFAARGRRPRLPQGWRVVREKTAGGVACLLCQPS